MLYIDKLTIQLPNGFEHRARDIATALADSLSNMEFNKGTVIDRVNVPAITINSRATNADIVQSLSTSINSVVGGKVNGR